MPGLCRHLQWRRQWSLDYQIEQGQLQPATRHVEGRPVQPHSTDSTANSYPTAQENLAFHDQQNLPKIGETAKSWMGVPLLVGGNIIGVMAIQARTRATLHRARWAPFQPWARRLL
jgi:hypothetical protein